MDRVERYREIVRRVINVYANLGRSDGQVVSEAIVDPERDHFEVLNVGWQGERRIHGSIIHIDIIDGKVWIQYDGTNWPVADELVAAGIPKSDIVLAWHPADLRHHTGFAVS